MWAESSREAKEMKRKAGFSSSIPLCPSMFIHDPALFTRLADATPFQR